MAELTEEQLAYIDLQIRLESEEDNTLGVLRKNQEILQDSIFNILQDEFILKYKTQLLDEKIRQDIYDDLLSVRKKTLDLIEGYCMDILKQFKNDKEQFNLDYGWYVDPATRLRYDIQYNEVLKEIAILVKKCYYDYFESRLPDHYRLILQDNYKNDFLK